MAVRSTRLSGPARLRRQAIGRLFAAPTGLRETIERLGFVQADPIRCPATAQDLILRNRVEGYRADDLERRYPSLEIDEDMLYAYGFVPRTVRNLLHPRKHRALTGLEKKVLDAVREQGPTHPASLEAQLGRRRVVNAWGGRSLATTRALDALQHRGLLRVARRDGGVRVYEPAAPATEGLPRGARLRALILVVARIFTPVPRRALSANVARFRHLGDPRAAIADLLKTGELETETVDGVAYVWPFDEALSDEVPREVRFLAPFDPVVWDRVRFEHLWGWRYRFEAYTPIARRVRGYYALPLAWGDAVIGWVNARLAAGRLELEVGFAERRPRDGRFRAALDAEVARLETFLSAGETPRDLATPAGGRTHRGHFPAVSFVK